MKKSLVSILALSAATPALAQTDPAPESGDRDIVVTASRSGDGIPVDQLGASVTILSPQQLEDRQTRIVSDILRDVPGVAVNRTGAIGGQTQIRMRGSEGNHVLVLIDGIEAADPFAGEFDFGTLIADPAARIEVLRGQQSALYGSDAIGGVIHYITATGAEAPGVSLRAEGGSFGTGSAAARAAGVAGDLDYAFTASYYHTDGFPTARGGLRNVGSDSLGLSGRIIWSPSELFRMTAVARYSLTEAERNNSEGNPASPLYGYTVDSPGVRFENEAIYALIRAEGNSEDERFRIALTGQLSDVARDDFVNDTVDNGGSRGRRYKGSLETSYRFGTDRAVHRLTGAVDLEREEFQNLSPFGFQGVRSVENLGFVGQYEFVLADALSLGASVRHDRNTYFDDPTTFRLQGSYRFASGTRIRAAYGTGVKNPGFFELFGFIDGVFIGNADLRPEESQGYEIGVEQELGGLGRIGATWFDATLEDEITTVFGPGGARPINLATESEQRGAEIFAELRPHRQVSLDVAYTYLDAQENGAREVRRPEHVASVNLTGRTADERLSGTLTVRYNGEMIDVAFLDPVNFSSTRVTLGDYVLVNIAAEYRITPNISVYGRVENLLDESYEEVFSFASAGLAGYGGVRVRF